MLANLAQTTTPGSIARVRLAYVATTTVTILALVLASGPALASPETGLVIVAEGWTKGDMQRLEDELAHMGVGGLNFCTIRDRERAKDLDPAKHNDVYARYRRLAVGKPCPRTAMTYFLRIERLRAEGERRHSLLGDTSYVEEFLSPGRQLPRIDEIRATSLFLAKHLFPSHLVTALGPQAKLRLRERVGDGIQLGSRGAMTWWGDWRNSRAGAGAIRGDAAVYCYEARTQSTARGRPWFLARETTHPSESWSSRIQMKERDHSLYAEIAMLGFGACEARLELVVLGLSVDLGYRLNVALVAPRPVLVWRGGVTPDCGDAVSYPTQARQIVLVPDGKLRCAKESDVRELLRMTRVLEASQLLKSSAALVPGDWDEEKRSRFLRRFGPVPVLEAVYGDPTSLCTALGYTAKDECVAKISAKVNETTSSVTVPPCTGVGTPTPGSCWRANRDPWREGFAIRSEESVFEAYYVTEELGPLFGGLEGASVGVEVNFGAFQKEFNGGLSERLREAWDQSFLNLGLALRPFPKGMYFAPLKVSGGVALYVDRARETEAFLEASVAPLDLVLFLVDHHASIWALANDGPPPFSEWITFGIRWWSGGAVRWSPVLRAEFARTLLAKKGNALAFGMWMLWRGRESALGFSATVGGVFGDQESYLDRWLADR